MLKFYRKNLKFIIWTIVLSFVIWEVSAVTISRQSVSPYIGSVGHEKISHKEFMTTFRYYDLLAHSQEAQIETSQNQKGTKEAPKPEPLSFDQLRALTWQTIVLSREAKREGIRISDKEVQNEVEKLFSTGNGFNEEFYQTWVRTNFRETPRDFEETVRKRLAVQKIREKVLGGIPEKDRETRWFEWMQLILSRANVHDYSSQKPESTE